MRINFPFNLEMERQLKMDLNAASKILVEMTIFVLFQVTATRSKIIDNVSGT